MRDRPCHQRLDLAGFGDIGPHEQALAAVLADQFDGLRTLVAHVSDDHAGALRREASRGGPADAGAPAGHQYNLARVVEFVPRHVALQ